MRNWFITGGTSGGFGIAFVEAALDVGARAVIAAMGQDPPPRRLVLGSDGFDVAVATLESSLDFPAEAKV